MIQVDQLGPDTAQGRQGRISCHLAQGYAGPAILQPPDFRYVIDVLDIQ